MYSFFEEFAITSHCKEFHSLTELVPDFGFSSDVEGVRLKCIR